MSERTENSEPNDGHPPHNGQFDVHIPGMHWRPGTVPAWLRETSGENRWPVSIAVALAIGLQVALPANLGLGPQWLLPAMEIVLLVCLIAVDPVRITRDHAAIRTASLALTAVMAIANGASIVLLVHRILIEAPMSPTHLLASGFAIWLTNVIVFSLWFWEFDRGGPHARRVGRKPYADFLFPQMAGPGIADEHWEPQYIDYLYVAFTNSTAFSPTDTMPLTRWAKFLMLLQSAVSLVTVALVAARAVGILPTPS